MQIKTINLFGFKFHQPGKLELTSRPVDPNSLTCFRRANSPLWGGVLGFDREMEI